MALAGILLVSPRCGRRGEKFNVPEAPDPVLLSLTGLGALVINLSCALMLTRYRRHGGSLTRAAFLSARNDALANVAIVAAALRHGRLLRRLTTFLSFSLQTFDLLRGDAWLRALLNIALSVLLCLAGVAIGHLLAAQLNGGAVSIAQSTIEEEA